MSGLDLCPAERSEESGNADSTRLSEEMMSMRVSKRLEKNPALLFVALHFLPARFAASYHRDNRPDDEKRHGQPGNEPRPVRIGDVDRVVCVKDGIDDSHQTYYQADHRRGNEQPRWKDLQETKPSAVLRHQPQQIDEQEAGGERPQ